MKVVLSGVPESPITEGENPVKMILNKLIPIHKTYKYGKLLREVNNTNIKHQSMDENTKQFLIDFYKPFNMELEKIIEKDLSNWNK